MAGGGEDPEEGTTADNVLRLTEAVRETIAHVRPQVRALRGLAALGAPLPAPLMPGALAAAEKWAARLRELQETADEWAGRDDGPGYRAAAADLQDALGELRRDVAAAIAAIDGAAAHGTDSP